MGAFTIPIALGHPHSGDLREVEAVVDTGAIDSMVPASLLTQLHVRPLWSILCVLADGSEREYGRGIARIAIEDVEAPCPVLFGNEDSKCLLGATALEIFDLMVDPEEQRLVRRSPRVARHL